MRVGDEVMEKYTNNSEFIDFFYQFLSTNNATLDDFFNNRTDDQKVDLIRNMELMHIRKNMVSEDPQNGGFIYYPEYKANKSLMLYVPPILVLFGTLGNIFSFLVLCHKTMTRLSTNLFLSALSVADTLVLFVGLFRVWIGVLTGIDIQDESNWLCKTVNVLGYSSSQFSVWLIIAVTIERYIVVCHPLQASRFCNINRARKVICSLAFAFLLINIHLLWTLDIITEQKNGKDIRKCDGAGHHEYLVNVVWPKIDGIIYSFSPFLIISLFNVLIVRQVVRATHGRGVLQNGSTMIKMEVRRTTVDSNVKITIMLLTVSFTFLACTLPMSICLIANVIWNKYSNDPKFLLIRVVSEMLMYLNHSINFFLYCAMGQKFRKQVQRLVCGKPSSHFSNPSDHSQHLYCSRAGTLNGYQPNKAIIETTV